MRRLQNGGASATEHWTVEVALQRDDGRNATVELNEGLPALVQNFGRALLESLRVEAGSSAGSAPNDDLDASAGPAQLLCPETPEEYRSAGDLCPSERPPAVPDYTLLAGAAGGALLVLLVVWFCFCRTPPPPPKKRGNEGIELGRSR